MPKTNKTTPTSGPQLMDAGKPVPGARTRAGVLQRSIPNTRLRQAPKWSKTVGAPAPAPGALPRGPVVPQVLPGFTGYDTRYQVLPGEAVEGAGFARAGVGIDITTGRPWQG